MKPAFTTGSLAYFDSMRSGLVPCKVIAVSAHDRQDLSPGLVRVTVRFTANRGAYKAGETWTGSPSTIIPRSHVRGLRGMSPRIVGGYQWVADHA